MDMTNLWDIYVVKTSNIADECYYVTLQSAIAFVEDQVRDGYITTIRLDKVAKQEWDRLMATMDLPSAATPPQPSEVTGQPTPATPTAAKGAKYNAGNNEVCARVKARYNAKIYSIFLRVANIEGIYAAVRKLLSEYVAPDSREQVERELYGRS